MVKRKPVNYKALVIESGVPIPKKRSATKRGVFFVKHGQSGRSFLPTGYQMQANRYVANYQDDLGNKYTVTVEAQS